MSISRLFLLCIAFGSIYVVYSVITSHFFFPRTFLRAEIPTRISSIHIIIELALECKSVIIFIQLLRFYPTTSYLSRILFIAPLRCIHHRYATHQHKRHRATKSSRHPRLWLGRIRCTSPLSLEDNVCDTKQKSSPDCDPLGVCVVATLLSLCLSTPSDLAVLSEQKALGNFAALAASRQFIIRGENRRVSISLLSLPLCFVRTSLGFPAFHLIL